MKLLKVDLHIHTLYSGDCGTSLEKIVEAARSRGLDKIGVTDHNRLDGALALREMAPDLVIVGEEIITTHGELIAYFLKELVPPGLSPLEAIERLRAQNAVISVSHPLDRLRREAMSAAGLALVLGRVDALEVFNSRCIFPADNAKALALARERGLLATAGSDAHTAWEIGRAYVEMPPFTNRDEFVASLAQGRVVGRYSLPLIHFVSTWNRLRARLRV
jgi:predicted metal-dependent phosphoesterase TrpH